MDALKPLSPVDSSNLLRRRRRRLESSTFQKEYNVKQGRRTPPTLDKQNWSFVAQTHWQGLRQSCTQVFASQMQFSKKLSSQRWTKSHFAMAGSKDSNGGWGQHIFQKVLKIIASFSEELLAHRCGISDVVFEEGCVILVKKVASFLTCFCNSRCRRSTCTAMRADPSKLCFSWHRTCQVMSLEALFKLGPDSGRS